MSELRSPAFVGEQPRAEQHPRRTSLEPVAAVWAFEVVEAVVVLEIPFHGSHPAVVRTAEGAAPQLGQDCALQALDEAVGPRMTRPRTARPLVRPPVRHRRLPDPSQSLPARLRTVTHEDRVHPRGTAPPLPEARPRQLIGDPLRAVGRPGQRVGQHGVLQLWRRLPCPALRPARSWHESGVAVAQVAPPPAIEQCPRDAELPAGLGDVAGLLRPLHDFEPQRHYTVREGHEARSPFVVGQTTIGECRTTLVLSGTARKRLRQLPAEPRSPYSLSSRSWVSALKVQTLRPNRTG